MASSFDVHFTLISQCDPGDCDAQKAYFSLAPHANVYDAFDYKFLLDMDGNAFSGRYYAFLLSNSQVFKLALFREWHDEVLRPWVHYAPLSLQGGGQGEEVFEVVRYFDQEEVGRMQARGMAEKGREWAGMALRNEDLESWFFRLLLEFGRVLDDNRENIGFSV